jgi:Holliday junction DNA helicase RuvB
MLFIDEIHRLNPAVEEVLYPAMESGVLDIIIGKGPSARTIQLDLPPFTLLAATTRIALLSAPLRSRFSGGVFRLEFYSEDELTKIVERSAAILGVAPAYEAAREVARRSRFTPRTANYLLKRCRDFSEVRACELSREAVVEALALLEIDEIGLTPSDRHLLETLVGKFGGGPVGLGTLAASLAEEAETLEEVHEPYLMRAGLIERTPRGRIATALAYRHLGISTPATAQKKLL